jgi:hypothetical protein
MTLGGRPGDELPSVRRIALHNRTALSRLNT